MKEPEAALESFLSRRKVLIGDQRVEAAGEAAVTVAVQVEAAAVRRLKPVAPVVADAFGVTVVESDEVAD